jgi:hypothetical protein
MSLVGRLEDLAISDIFQILGVGRKTGTLIVRSERGTALIVFKGGAIVRAEATALGDTIGEELLRAGLLKPSVLQMAQGVKRSLPQKPMAEILLELGAVKRETLERATKKRIQRVITELLQWEEGEFSFELDELSVNGKAELHDQGWELSKGLSAEYVLMEGARVYDELSHGIMTEEEEEPPAEEPWEEDWAAPPERKDISSLKALTQELRFPNSTSEITLLILRFASDIFQRGVLFMVAPEEMAGLGQFGLDIERADEKIREITLPVGESPFLQRVLQEGRPYKGPLQKDKITEFMLRELGGGWPAEVALFPVMAEGKTVALLYCDNISGEPMPTTEGLEIFISQAGLALEKALLQRRLQEMLRRKEG